MTSLKPLQQRGPTRVVASKSHLNAETRALFHTIEGEVELVRAGSSLKFLKVAEALAEIYPRLGPTWEWDTAAAQTVVLGVAKLVTDLDGAELRYDKDDILNPHFVVCPGIMTDVSYRLMSR